MKAAQASPYLMAWIFVTPDQIQEVTVSVVAHRLVMEPQARFSGQTARSVVEQVLKKNPRAGIAHSEFPMSSKLQITPPSEAPGRDSLARVSEFGLLSDFDVRSSILSRAVVNLLARAVYRVYRIFSGGRHWFSSASLRPDSVCCAR